MSLAAFGGGFLEGFNKSYGDEQEKQRKIKAGEDANQIKGLESLYKDEATPAEKRPQLLRQILKLQKFKQPDIDEIVGTMNDHAKMVGLKDAPKPASTPSAAPGLFTEEGPDQGSGEGSITPNTDLPTIASSTTTAVGRPQMPAFQDQPESFGNRNAVSNKAGRAATATAQVDLDKQAEAARYKQAVAQAEQDGTIARIEHQLGRPLKDTEKTAVVMKQHGVVQPNTARTFRPPVNGNQIPLNDLETGEEIKDSFGQAIKRDGSTQYRMVPDANGVAGFQPMDAIPSGESVKIEKVAGPNGTQVLAKVNKKGDILGFVNVNGQNVSPPVRMQAVTVTDPDSGQQYTKFVNPFVGGGATPATPIPARPQAQAQAPAAPGTASAPGPEEFSDVDFKTLKPGASFAGASGKQYVFKGVKDGHAVLGQAPANAASPVPKDPALVKGEYLLKTAPKAIPQDIRNRIEVIDKNLPIVNSIIKTIETEVPDAAKAVNEGKYNIGKEVASAISGHANMAEYNLGVRPTDPTRRKISRNLSLLARALTAPYMGGIRSKEWAALIAKHLPAGEEGFPLMLSKLYELRDQLPTFRNEELKSAVMRTVGGKVVGDHNAPQEEQ